MIEPAKIAAIKQPEEDACGPVAVQVAAKYFNKQVSFDEIVRLGSYDREEGMSNAQLVKTIESLGLKVRVVSPATWDILRESNTADSICIVSWMLNGYIGHLSTVDRITDTHVYLHNPESGEIDELEKLIFLRLWFDYDDLWYPEKNTDIQLRWMAIVTS